MSRGFEKIEGMEKACRQPHAKASKIDQIYSELITSAYNDEEELRTEGTSAASGNTARRDQIIGSDVLLPLVALVPHNHDAAGMTLAWYAAHR